MREPGGQGAWRREAVMVLATAACAVVALTWPLAKQINTAFPGHPRFTDTPIYLWDFWWHGTQFAHWFPHPLACDAILFPFGAQLAYHVNALYYAVLGAPLSWAFGVLPAFNLVLLSTFVTSAGAVYLLARWVGLDRPSALFAALLFAFSPYRLHRFLTHANMLKGDLIACYVAALILLLRPGQPWWRSGLFIGLFMSLSFYASLESPIYLGLVSLVFLCCMFRPWRDPGESRRMLGGFAVGALIAVLFMLPYMLAFYQQRMSGDYYVEQGRTGASLLSFVTPPAGSAFWRRVYAGLRPVPSGQEGVVFLGILPLFFFAAAWVRRAPHRELRFLKWLFAVFFVLSLGPTLRLADGAALCPLPMHWLNALPVLKEMRLPERFHEVSTLPFALLAGWGFMRISAWAPLRRWRVIFAAGCMVLALAEYGGRPIQTYRAVKAPFAAIKNDPAAVSVLDARANLNYGPLNQLWHGKRILGGSISRVAPDFRAYEATTPLVAQYNAPYAALRGTVDAFVSRPEAPSLALETAQLLDIRYAVLNIADDQPKRALIDLFPNTLAGKEGTVEVYHLDLPERAGLLPGDIRIGEGAWSAYLTHGWGQWARFPETVGGHPVLWPQSPRASVLFRTDQPTAMVITCGVFARAEAGGVHVEAAVNGHVLGVTDAGTGFQTLELSVPREYVRSGLNEVTFRWPGTDQDRVFVAANDCSAFESSYLWPWHQGGVFINGQHVHANQPGLNLIEFSEDGCSVRRGDALSWEGCLEEVRALGHSQDAVLMGCQLPGKMLPPEVRQGLETLGLRLSSDWANFVAFGRSGEWRVEGSSGPILLWAPGRCAFATFHFEQRAEAVVSGLRLLQ